LSSLTRYPVSHNPVYEEVRKWDFPTNNSL
jgi:hypothetical protein